MRIGPLAARWQALLHGACLERGEATIALFAPSGSGKSTLAAELSAQGRQLVSDDIVPLESGSLKAPPVPPLEVLARLTEDGSWIDLEPKRLELFLDWLATTPAHAITYRSMAAASAALAEILPADQSRQAPAVQKP